MSKQRQTGIVAISLSLVALYRLSGRRYLKTLVILDAEILILAGGIHTTALIGSVNGVNGAIMVALSITELPSQFSCFILHVGRKSQYIVECPVVGIPVVLKRYFERTCRLG